VLLTVKRRVVSVRPRKDDTFGVTLGPGPDVFWFLTSKPPDLGQLVTVEGAQAKRSIIRNTKGNVVGSITMLEGGNVSAEKDKFSRRVVAPQWVRRCHQTMRRPLHPHQGEGAGWVASRLSRKTGAILGDDPGLGKTAQVLAALAATNSLPVIIVCPPSVKHNWAREIRFLRSRLRVEIINGTRGPIPSAHVVILNYAIMKARERQLSQLKARCIVFDEGHQLKEPQPSKTHRAAVATRLAHRIKRCVLMTGTPLLNRPQELWRLLHMVDKSSWPSFADYRARYCASKDDSAMKSIVTKHGSVSRLEELRALSAPFILRRLKRDVLAKLPPKQRRQVMVDLDPFDKSNYKMAEKDVVSWLRKVASGDRAASAARGQAVVKLTMLRRIAAVGKLRFAVRGYLHAWFNKPNPRQLVIFAFHKQVIWGTLRICDQLGLKVATISGKDSDIKRQRAVDMFQSGNADVFIAPIRSAGVGLNLQRASDVLFLERLWTPALLTQAEDRVYRMGQTRQVTITYLDAAGTVDEYLAQVLTTKQKLIDQVVDGRKFDREHIIETIDEVMARVAKEEASAVRSTPRKRGQDKSLTGEAHGGHFCLHS
jgi:SWI/SNF-related matrix-associated actin-dependent regulator 1 of chromatin subfamily A